MNSQPIPHGGRDAVTALASALVDYRPVICLWQGGPPQGVGNATTEHVLTVTPALLPLLRQVNFTADLLFGDCVTATDPTAELITALSLLSNHGEGLLLSSVPLFSDHVWAQIKINDSLVANYFAKAKQTTCFRATIGGPDAVSELVSVTQSLKRSRLQYRRGAETRSYLQTTDSITKFDACKAQAEAEALPSRGSANLTLGTGGALVVRISAFDRLAKKFSESALNGLLALNGKDIKQIVVNRPLRQCLRMVLDGDYAVHPDVRRAYATHLSVAIAQLQALRAGIPATDLPAGLNAELRPYQKDGFDFLAHLARIGHGGILADDMGLGKTLQTLSWLLWLKQQASNGGPTLVVCPASVMHNWRREAEKFTPQLKVLVLESGEKRAAALKKISQFDLVVTNYALLRRDLAALSKIHYRAMVIDEAQFIKNPGVQITKAVKLLAARAQHRLALTGTPLENRLLDLWSIVDFVQPGYLGTQQEFSANYDSPGAAVAVRKDLRRQLRPIMLRRLKKDVAKDLPARIELRRDCHLGRAQMAYYREELARSRGEVFKAVKEKGIRQSKLHVLAALMRLRQICCHPALVAGPVPGGGSAKTEAFFELLDELRVSGKKVLVFSQFTRMLELLRVECQQRGIPTHLLTGETTDRQAVVDAFNSGPPQGVFLLSLRAAGTGLNLTSASEVILYDPWWNPAVEAQAIDRAHRIGQQCITTAHRLITRDTIEERIWTIQQAKARTISEVLGEGGFTRNLTMTDLEYLFGGDEPSLANEQAEPAPNDSETPTPICQLPTPNMIPRHPANQSGTRNTRAAHPVTTEFRSQKPEVSPPSSVLRPPPLWRQRLHQQSGVPAWRANYGVEN